MSLRNSRYDCVVPFSTKYAYVVVTIAIDSPEVNPAECLCRDRTIARWREVKVFLGCETKSDFYVRLP